MQKKIIILMAIIIIALCGVAGYLSVTLDDARYEQQKLKTRLDAAETAKKNIEEIITRHTPTPVKNSSDLLLNKHSTPEFSLNKPSATDMVVDSEDDKNSPQVAIGKLLQNDFIKQQIEKGILPSLKRKWGKFTAGISPEKAQQFYSLMAERQRTQQSTAMKLLTASEEEREEIIEELKANKQTFEDDLKDILAEDYDDYQHEGQIAQSRQQLDMMRIMGGFSTSDEKQEQLAEMMADVNGQQSDPELRKEAYRDQAKEILSEEEHQRYSSAVETSGRMIEAGSSNGPVIISSGMSDGSGTGAVIMSQDIQISK